MLQGIIYSGLFLLGMFLFWKYVTKKSKPPVSKGKSHMNNENDQEDREQETSEN